jgi:hypothetical protein
MPMPDSVETGIAVNNKNSYSHTDERDAVELRAVLHQLDRRDWWRWAAAIVIMLLVTMGVFALSLPNLRRSFEEQQQLDLAVFGLMALILLFDAFSVYQQIQINRMRRQLAAKMAMALTDEVLRPHDVEVREIGEDERRTPRFSLDHRLTVRATLGDKETVGYGRTSDICVDGIGALISESLPHGTPVILEMTLSTRSETLRLAAVVCYRRGFLHGFKFTNLTLAQAAAISRACGDLSARASSEEQSLSEGEPNDRRRHRWQPFRT